MWKMYVSEFCRFCIILYYAWERLTTMLQCGKPFFARNATVYKFENFTGLYFPHFTILCNQTSQRYQIKGSLSNCADECSQFKNLSNRGMVYWESAWQKPYSRWRIYIRPVHTMALAGLERPVHQTFRNEKRLPKRWVC